MLTEPLRLSQYKARKFGCRLRHLGYGTVVSVILLGWHGSCARATLSGRGVQQNNTTDTSLFLFLVRGSRINDFEFITPRKVKPCDVVLAFESVAEISKCGSSNESY